jgi:glucosyl-dolichyl phosphate glucuronosyltransferase
MDISVIICTYNRAATLSRCLAYLAAQRVPEGVGWEVVVVDNNSTDHTSKVVKDAAAKGLPILYVHEASQGLCYARNRGIENSRGSIIAYIDDDILTDPEWLIGLVSVFQKTGCDAAGGPIHLETEGKPLPKWLLPPGWGYLGHIDHGEKMIALDGRKHYPHGGNMAFRREVFDNIGKFDVRLGRTGNKQFKGEETEYFSRLASRGAKIIYEPKAKVLHLIKPRELTKRHFRILQLRSGELQAQTESTVYRNTIVGIPLFICREFAKSFKTYLSALSQNRWIRFRRELDLWALAGYVWGKLDLHRES